MSEGKVSECKLLGDKMSESKDEGDNKIPEHKVSADEALPVINFEDLPVVYKDMRCALTTGSFGTMEFICHGSNSNVYKVQETLSSPTLILKVINDKGVDNKQVQREYERERIILHRVRHENIVELKGLGVMEKGKPMILLEQLGGKTLSYHLMNFSGAGNRCFSTHRVLEIARQLCDALAYIHYEVHPKWVLIHRDLKPDNIGFTENGTVKLMDFGLCVYTRRGGHREDVYQLSGCTGSLRYMAPEVAKRFRYNERVDVYSFGLIVYELLTGIPPFSGLNRETFYNKVVDNHLRPSLVTSENGRRLKIFPGGAELLGRCWAPESRDRPNMLEIRELLSACLVEKEKRLASEGWLKKTFRNIKGAGPI